MYKICIWVNAAGPPEHVRNMSKKCQDVPGNVKKTCPEEPFFIFACTSGHLFDILWTISGGPAGLFFTLSGHFIGHP